MVFAGSGKLVSITVEGCGSTAGSSGDDPAVGPVGGAEVTGGTEAGGGTDGADIPVTGGELEAELAGGTMAELGVITEGVCVGAEEETGGGICMVAEDETVGTSADGWCEGAADETAVGGGSGLQSVVFVTI